jgi:hypothetical protein
MLAAIAAARSASSSSSPPAAAAGDQDTSAQRPSAFEPRCWCGSQLPLTPQDASWHAGPLTAAPDRPRPQLYRAAARLCPRQRLLNPVARPALRARLLRSLVRRARLRHTGRAACVFVSAPGATGCVDPPVRPHTTQHAGLSPLTSSGLNHLPGPSMSAPPSAAGLAGRGPRTTKIV